LNFTGSDCFLAAKQVDGGPADGGRVGIACRYIENRQLEWTVRIAHNRPKVSQIALNAGARAGINAREIMKTFAGVESDQGELA
jgi:hypothetical protein